MKKTGNNLFLLMFVGILIFAAGGCIKQEASKANVEDLFTINSSDAEISAAQEVIKSLPDGAIGYNNLAIIYIRRARETGDFSLNAKAEAAIKRALELKPDNYDAQKIQASLLLTFHRFDEGLEAGKKLQPEHPQDAFIYGVLTDANVELGNYEEAIDAVQKMVDLRPNMESYSRVSYVRSLHGDSDGAIEAMSIAARIADPKNKEAQAWCLTHLGDEYFKVGRLEEAEKQYDAALINFPNYHFALAGKGKSRASFGDYENAIKFYTQAQQRVPLTLTEIALGDIYTKTGKPDEAKKQYELAEFIEQKLGNIDQRTLALMWADQNTKLDEALAIAEKEHAVRKDIFTAGIYAWCLYNKGDFQAAQKAINEAMRLKTKDARFFYHAGMIEKGLGNGKAAKDYLKKALDLNPSFDILQAEKAKTALRELN